MVTEVSVTTPDLHDIDKRLTSHEAVCAERYGTLRTRVSRIEALGWSILTATMTTTIGGLAFLAWFFFAKTLKL
jgi:hypothetical protein